MFKDATCRQVIPNSTIKKEQIVFSSNYKKIAVKYKISIPKVLSLCNLISMSTRDCSRESIIKYIEYAHKAKISPLNFAKMIFDFSFDKLIIDANLEISITYNRETKNFHCLHPVAGELILEPSL